MAKLPQHCQKISNATKMNSNSIVVTKVKRTRKTVPRDSPPQRSSIYRGVTRHRWTGRYEAHLWDKNCWNESQNKKGRQVYLGAYDDEDAAAHAYDLAALKYWGQDTILNFTLMTYQKELKDMENQSREEYIGSLRRKSSGFSRGVSKFRGVARHHHNGRWEARIGRVFGNKYLYLGTYATQEEAAVAYDMAAIEYRGLNAVTNFDLSRYIKWLRPDNNNSASTNSDQPISPNPNSVKVANLTPVPTPPPSHIAHLQQGLNFPIILHQEQLPQLSTATDDHDHPTPITHSRPTTATSALGLLLQSSKFKEMMEMTTAAECYTTITTTTQPDQKSSSSLDPRPPRCSFPEEIQTHFGISTQDLSSYGGSSVDDFIFGDLNAFMHSMLQTDFEA